MPAHATSQPDHDRIIDAVATAILSRHPEFSRDAVRAEVADSFHRLEPGARIPDHLALLIQHQVTDRLNRIVVPPGQAQPTSRDGLGSQDRDQIG